MDDICMPRSAGSESPGRRPKPHPQVQARGYFGIGIVNGTSPSNIGALSRSAHALGAALIFTVAFQIPSVDMRSDPTKAARHIPFIQFSSLEDFMDHRPEGCELVGVEYEIGAAEQLPDFRHPTRALYLLGAEGPGLDDQAIAACDRMVQIPSRYPLNVATTGGIVLYDRLVKSRRSGQMA